MSREFEQMTDPDQVKARMAKYVNDIMRSPGASFFEVRCKCNSFKNGWARLTELLDEEEVRDFVRSMDLQYRTAYLTEMSQEITDDQAEKLVKDRPLSRIHSERD